MDRYAIIGTAPSFMQTPWQDTTLLKCGLNDGYQLPGIGTCDEWYDLHGLNRFFYPPDPPPGQKTQIYDHHVPFGYYVRPKTHLDWLATQPFPRWLHPDHATQVPGSDLWPGVQAFPKAEIEAHFGQYFGSTPAWMLAHAILRGAKEIHIYGIHLSTESEYIEQRPNFEFLIGCVLGAGKRKLSVHNSLRRYETENGLVVLPESAPILQATYQYAFEPAPRRKQAPLKWEMHKACTKRDRRAHALQARAWWSPLVTMDEPDHAGVVHRRRAWPSTIQQEVRYYDAFIGDCQEQMARMTAGI